LPGQQTGLSAALSAPSRYTDPAEFPAITACFLSVKPPFLF